MRAPLQIPPIRRARDLLHLLQLPENLLSAEAEQGFSTLVSSHYASLMRPGDPHDPLLRQVLPLSEECLEVPGFVADPVGDTCAVQDSGILQKYAGRVLVMPTAACAVHCRHCFRREFPYQSLRSQDFASRLATFLEGREDIEEVILSGGDPLMLADRAWAELVAALARAPRLQRLRIHTRIPVVDPSRINSTLLDALCSLPLTRILVAHVNHAQELDTRSAEVFATLRARGFTLLNQSVLLRGVNDSVEALAQLSRALFSQGVLPYYLHQLDRVRGAAHFEVPESAGHRLMQALSAQLPGYLVPRYVREVEGAPGKTALLPTP